MRFRLRSSGRTTGIAAILLLLLLAINSSQALAQQAQIGIYSDVSRSSCSLSDAGGGQIRAYVMVNSTTGITGVRFSAPKPACFNATWVSDETPEGFASIGDSQTDISVATGGCVTGLQHVLTMVFQSTSTSTPCCLFQIQPAQDQDDIVYTDCTFAQFPLGATNAYVNGNATCPCSSGLDQPPSAAFNPFPVNGTTNHAATLTLQWQATDPESEPLTYDLYFGTEADPPLKSANLPAPSYDISGLSYATLYHWKVVVKDNAGNSTMGLVWSFSTGAEGGLPPTPVKPSPPNNATGVLRKLTLTWQKQGGSGPLLGYQVHFGTTNPPPLVRTIPISPQSFAVDSLALDTTYYWYVVAIGQGKTVQGDLWSFHTVFSNPPPFAPSNPVPANQSMAVPTILQWSDNDPEGQPLEYDVYFGTDAVPPLVGHRTTPSYNLGALVANTTYHWRVVAFDNEGGSTSGSDWTFTTNGVNPPTTPQLVAPLAGSTISPHNVHFEWSSSDPEGGPLHYTLYFDTANPPVSHVDNLTTPYYNAPSNLPTSRTIYWKVVAIDQDTQTAAGPVWSFNTRALLAPNQPSSPSPVNGATGVSRTPTLTWQCSDPDNQPLTYTVRLGPNTFNDITVKSFTPAYTLPVGTTTWQVTAYDTDGLYTSGPTWSFSTIGVGGPPSTPQIVAPPDNATDQPLTLDLKWSATDPDGFPLKYDVYLGPNGAMQKVASNVAQNFYTATDLLGDTVYSWRIVARDVDGYTTTGPIWYFTTLQGNAPRLAIGLYSDASGTSCTLADKGAGLRNVYVVLNGPKEYTGMRFAATKPPCFNATWMYDTTPYASIGNSQTDVSIGFGGCTPAPIMAMTITYMSSGSTQGCCSYAAVKPINVYAMQATDCGFNTQIPTGEPALGISSNDACPVCESKGYLAVAETADTCRVSGVHPFTVDLTLNPSQDTDAGSIDVTIDPSLTFASCQRGTMIEDWATFTYSLQNNVLHISAAGTTIPAGTSGTFARLTFNSDCCDWGHPAELGLLNAGSDFVGLHLLGTKLSCHYAPNGDVNNDGSLTVADAQCALETYLYAPQDPPSDCGGVGASNRADVDCNGFVTPGDAQCIFRNWLDQSCSFCNGTLAERAARGPAPQLSLRALREDDDIVIVLHANGVQSIGALGFEVKYPAGITFVRVEPPRKDTFAALQTRSIADGRARVGAYVTSGKELASDGDILAIRFHAGDVDARGVVALQEFVDDLDGAAQVSVSLEGAASTTTPTQIVLHQNSPNPFNPQTMIRFELPEPMRVRLSVFDVHGRLVKQLLDERREAGASMVEWDGTDSHGRTVATGVYFYVLDAGGSRYQHKMVLLK